jgi:hypothetical protein
MCVSVWQNLLIKAQSKKVSRKVSTDEESQRNKSRPSAPPRSAEKVNVPRLCGCWFIRTLSEQSAPDVLNWCVYVCVGVTCCD